MITVYKITNKITGKCYIGITKTTLEKRWRQHVLYAERKKRTGSLQRAILKYGPEAFAIDAVYEAVNEREACATERGLIAQYGTIVPSGYNMSSGGEFRGGHVLSEVTKKRMRKTALGRVISDKQKSMVRENMKRLWADGEYRAMISAARNTEKAIAARKVHHENLAAMKRGKPGFFTGYKHSEESKVKMSAASKGRPAWNKGLPMSDAQIELLRKVHMGSKHTEEHRAKIRAAGASPEAKEKRRQTTLARWANPEGRKKMLANRTYPKRPPMPAEQKKLMSEIMKAAMAKAVADPERLDRMRRVGRESALRQRDTKRYGASIASIRAMARKLPTEIIPREVSA